MNIQDEMQKIHHKYGVSEMANYKIEQFVEKLIEKDRAEQLKLHIVSQQRELLVSFVVYAKGRSIRDINIDDDTILYFLEYYNCG